MTSALAAAYVLPISVVIVRAISSRSASSRSAAARIQPARSANVVRRSARNASCDRPIAASIWSGLIGS